MGEVRAGSLSLHLRMLFTRAGERHVVVLSFHRGVFVSFVLMLRPCAPSLPLVRAAPSHHCGSWRAGWESGLPSAAWLGQPQPRFC